MYKKITITSIVFVYGLIISVFHFYQNIEGGLSDLWFNAFHFSLFSSLGFLIYPFFKKINKINPFDVCLAILSLLPAFYLVFFEESFYTDGSIMRASDTFVAITAIVLALEIVRRTVGYTIPVLTILAISYILFLGSFFDGVFAFEGLSVDRFLYRVIFTDEGLFGSITTISATYVFMFILFASFLLKSGAGDFIVDLSKGITSKFTGGAGHVAVLSSAVMGTISGSAVANTVSTGSITINMMKKNRFDPTFAAAVEAAASTGGQIMPPIMGAGIFVMTQITQIPLHTIIVVSILPAILYFASISFYIYLHAKKRNITVDKQDVNMKKVLREGAHFFIPLVCLVFFLMKGYTPTYAAGISILVIIASSYLTANKKMTPKIIIEALSDGARNMVVTAVLLSTIGVVVGAINISGLGITFSQMIVQWSDNQLIIALILIALASLIIGMGLPPTASYVVIAILCAPALIGLMLGPEKAALISAGVVLPEVVLTLLSAHLIIFWLSQDSNLTPPVCLAAFAAAAIAKTPPMKTGFKAWKIGKGLYIVPLLFAYTPLVTGDWIQKFEVFIFAMLGLFSLAIVMENFYKTKLKIYERVIFLIATILLFTTDKLFGLEKMNAYTEYTHLMGFLVFTAIMLYFNFFRINGTKIQTKG